MPRRPIPRIFAIEAPWSSSLRDRRSVSPVVELLDQISGPVESIHNKVHTREEFLFLLKRWPQDQYKRFSLGYIVGHGSPGQLHIGRYRLSLEEMARAVPRKLSGKIVHFGSCDVMQSSPAQIEAFRRESGARGVCGFSGNVNWLEAASFELLLLSAMSRYARLDAIDRYLKSTAGPLRRQLGFRLYYGRKRS